MSHLLAPQNLPVQLRSELEVLPRRRKAKPPEACLQHLHLVDLGRVCV